MIFDACVHDDRDPNLMKFLKRDDAFTKDLVMFEIFSIILSTLGFIHSFSVSFKGLCFTLLLD